MYGRSPGLKIGLAEIKNERPKTKNTQAGVAVFRATLRSVLARSHWLRHPTGS